MHPSDHSPPCSEGTPNSCPKLPRCSSGGLDLRSMLALWLPKCTSSLLCLSLCTCCSSLLALPSLHLLCLQVLASTKPSPSARPLESLSPKGPLVIIR